MELFYSNSINNGICTLAEEESRHCAKVLRHEPGDTINVIDGCGSMYRCTIMECGKQVVCNVEEEVAGFGAHGYHLTMAVCPTKNIDRYEWFLEKATEMGVDVVVPVIGEHSERRIIKPERLEKILVSAAKQSLKGAIPQLQEMVTVKEFIRSAAPLSGVKLIAYCGEQEKVTLAEAVSMAREQVMKSDMTIQEHTCPREKTTPGNQMLTGNHDSAIAGNQMLNGNQVQAVAGGCGLQVPEGNRPEITILIGPEGDFSPAEVDAALAAGFHPLTLGASRLRTETAAVAAVAGVYFMI